MKGPGLKLDLDVRRLWKCPQTGETIRLSGDVVAKPTEVNGETVFMQLVEEKRNLYRDPFHFEYRVLAESDQSSSERAAAAARSIEEIVLVEEVATEEMVVETQPPATEDSAAPAQPASELANEEPTTAEDEDDSFGGGLL